VVPGLGRCLGGAKLATPRTSGRGHFGVIPQSESRRLESGIIGAAKHERSFGRELRGAVLGSKVARREADFGTNGSLPESHRY